MDRFEMVKGLLDRHKTSVYRLIQMTELPASTLYSMFNRKSIPTDQTMERICMAFGMSVEDVYAEYSRDINTQPEQPDPIKANIMKYTDMIVDRLTDNEKRHINVIVKNVFEMIESSRADPDPFVEDTWTEEHTE